MTKRGEMKIETIEANGQKVPEASMWDGLRWRYVPVALARRFASTACDFSEREDFLNFADRPRPISERTV